MGIERSERSPSWYYARLAGGVAAAALAAACTGGSKATTTVATPDTRHSVSPSVELSPSTAPSITQMADCNSIRAVRPKAYFNDAHLPAIAAQLDLIRLAVSPTGNVDIDDDGRTYVDLVHQMEEDPLYAEAMDQAYERIAEDPSDPLHAKGVRALHVPKPQFCARHTLTDAASHEQLVETREVAIGVGDGLLHHLEDQGSRAAHMFASLLRQQLSQLETKAG